jgi:hypothetical protein
MKRRTLLQLTTLAVSLPLALSPAQQPVASPNWADTIAWINNAISENAHMSYSSIAGFDPSQSETHSVSYVPGPSVNCHLTFVMNDTVRYKNKLGASSEVDPITVDFDLSQWIVASVKPISFDLRSYAFDIMGGAADSTMNVSIGSAANWQLTAQILPPGNTSPGPYEGFYPEEPIVFTDQSMATRVATALNHAVDLCGGKHAPAQIF